MVQKSAMWGSNSENEAAMVQNGSSNGVNECKGEQMLCKRVQRGAVMVQKSAKGSSNGAN